MSTTAFVSIGIPIFLLFHFRKKESNETSLLFQNLELRIKAGVNDLKTKIKKETKKLRSQGTIEKIMKEAEKESLRSLNEGGNENV